jgi:hypothetical protein
VAKKSSKRQLTTESPSDEICDITEELTITDDLSLKTERELDCAINSTAQCTENPSSKCKIILTKGTRKNDKCNRKVQENGLCKMHLVLEQKKPDNPFETHEKTVTRNNQGVWTDGADSFDDEQVQACYR